MNYNINVNEWLAQFQRISDDDLILFTRQLSVVFRAGLPVTRALRVLERQTENTKLKRVTGEIYEEIERGSDLSDAFRKHQDVFSSLYCSMVAAGEVSGRLDEVLDRLTYILEHERNVKQEIKKAMRYPKMVVSVLTIAFIVFVTYVFPRFQKLFTAQDIEMPLPTKICIGLSNFVTDNMVGLGLIAVAGFFVLRLFLKTPAGKVFKDSLALRIPGLRDVLVKATMSRFSAIFAILQASGVPLLRALDILQKTIENAVVRAEFTSVSESVERGGGIAEPLGHNPHFPPLMVNMIAVGEKSGQMETMLNEVARHYDVEVEMAMNKFAETIPVVLTLGLACLVGFVALAIYLPILNLTEMAG